MKVSRITTAKMNGKDYIRLYGYNQNNIPIKQLKQFRNYVYVQKQNISKISSKYNVDVDSKIYKPYDYNINNKQIYKVYLNNKSFFIPKYIKDLSYQSDVPVQVKYINDNDMQFSRTRHIAYFDIETYYDQKNPKNNNAERALAPVTSITFYSNHLKKYFILVWHKTIEVKQNQPFNIQVKNQNENYYYFDNEFDMLQTFCFLIKQFNVDILTGWYSHGYDVPYIINRLENIGLSKNFLSPVGNSWISPPRGGFNRFYNIKIAGLDSIDMMDVISGLNYNLQNNKLDTAAAQILGDQFRKVTQATWRDWQDNLQGFLKYAVRDVQILVKLDEKLKVFQFLIQTQQLSNAVPLNNTQSSTKLNQSLFLKKYWHDYVLPNIKNNKSQKFKGGLTIQPTEPGVHRNVAVFDYASLYPVTIVAYNISPETFLFSLQKLGRKEFDKSLQYLNDNDIKYIDTGESEQLFGGRYIFLAHEQKLGIYPKLVKQLYLLRKEYKKVTKMKDKTEQQKIIADKRQYAIKIIINSMYGAMGFRFYRLFVPQCADATTYFGRGAARYAMDKLSSCGTILYGDTDSCAQNSIIRYRIKQK